MKNNMTLGKFFRKIALWAVVVCPLAMSCENMELYDDTEIKEQLEDIVNRLYALESKMNTEFRALVQLLDGKFFVSSVETDEKTGVTVVKCVNADGKEHELTLYPKEKLEAFMTYMTLGDGVNYWAYVDEDGRKQLYLDEKGRAVPVLSGLPEVIVRDEENYLLIGGKEYPLAGNSVFSDYELVTGPAGEIYAVTFTFGEDMSFTVTVGDTAGFIFVQSIGFSKEQIHDFYVAKGQTSRVEAQAKGVVGYIVQAPYGWKVKEAEDIYMGEKFFYVTAPTAEAVRSGAAEGEGILKVIAVLEGGKSSITSLELSSEPFSEFDVTLGAVNMKMRNGLYKFIYGVENAETFSEEAVFAKAEILEDANDAGVSFFDIQDCPLQELADEELVPGNKYVLWAVPALYDEEAEEYHLCEGTVVYSAVDYIYARFEVSHENIRDARLDLELKGIDSYYLELVPEADFDMEDVLAKLSVPGSYTPKTAPAEPYSGSLFDFASVAAQSSTKYVAWMAVAEDGKEYVEKDLLIREFATLAPSAGSDVKVSAEVEETIRGITADLTAEGAESINYGFFTPSVANTFTDEESKIKYLFENGTFKMADSVQAKLSDYVKSAKPGTSYVLWAVATDTDGKYGELLVVECQVKPLEYNDIKIEVGVGTNGPDLFELLITATGGEPVEYLYWLGKTTVGFWKNSYQLGASAEKAQEYMYLHAADDDFSEAASAYPIENGMISLTDHEAGVEYVLVIMAKGKEGFYSKATAFKFRPHAVNLGTIVMATEEEKYEKARPTVEWNEELFRAGVNLVPGAYAYSVTVPMGYTAYVLSGSETYLTDGEETDRLPVADEILKIVATVDKPRDDSKLIDPSKEYPYDSEFYHCEHGYSMQGNAVIWADKEKHDERCDCGSPTETDGTRNGLPVKVKHLLTVNDGNPVDFYMGYASGKKDEVIDIVFVVCVDKDGNFYETFRFPVPPEYFANAAD